MEKPRTVTGKIRPLQGQVLVELSKPPTGTDSGLALPENRTLKDGIGKEPALEGIVRSCGIWATNTKGWLIPYEIRKGDRVLVDPVLGKHVLAYPFNLRMYDRLEILALVK